MGGCGLARGGAAGGGAPATTLEEAINNPLYSKFELSGLILMAAITDVETNPRIPAIPHPPPSSPGRVTSQTESSRISSGVSSAALSAANFFWCFLPLKCVCATCGLGIVTSQRTQRSFPFSPRGALASITRLTKRPYHQTKDISGIIQTLLTIARCCALNNEHSIPQRPQYLGLP